MAKRILSADSVLVTQAQVSLGSSVRTEKPLTLLDAVREHWAEAQHLPAEAVLFDWNDQAELFNEIAFINKTQSRLDEVAVKIAPSLLRIVLTVKEHIPTPKGQRAFLAEHLELDFRRISELCIVADSYALLDAEHRKMGEREIIRYGWSKALKLAHVREAGERDQIWEAACDGRPMASYRSVLEEIRRFRERKLIAPPSSVSEVTTHLDMAQTMFTHFSGLASRLDSREDLEAALKELGGVRRELGRLQKALQDQLMTAETEALAANA